MKHLKIFNTTAEYQQYFDNDPVLPNVSFIEESNGVTYNPDVEEIIEASFEIEMHPGEWFVQKFGELNGDFTDLYEQLYKFIVDNATIKYEDGNCYVNSDVTLAKTKIFVNGDRVDELNIYPQQEAIYMWTDGQNASEEAHAQLETNCIRYSCGNL